MQQTIQELIELAEAEGITLPLPPETIMRMEKLGHVVDLRTGAVIINGADQRYSLTVIGEAELIAFNAGLSS